MISVYTAGEIVVWLVAAAVLGVVLGWLLHVLWARARGRRSPLGTGRQEPVPVVVVEPEGGDPQQVQERLMTPRIKGNQTSMIYHTHDSPAYERTHADVWFDTEPAAEAAGFRKPKNA